MCWRQHLPDRELQPIWRLLVIKPSDHFTDRLISWVASNLPCGPVLSVQACINVQWMNPLLMGVHSAPFSSDTIPVQEFTHPITNQACGCLPSAMCWNRGTAFCLWMSVHMFGHQRRHSLTLILQIIQNPAKLVKVDQQQYCHKRYLNSTPAKITFRLAVTTGSSTSN